MSDRDAAADKVGVAAAGPAVTLAVGLVLGLTLGSRRPASRRRARPRPGQRPPRDPHRGAANRVLGVPGDRQAGRRGDQPADHQPAQLGRRGAGGLHCPQPPVPKGCRPATVHPRGRGVANGPRPCWRAAPSAPRACWSPPADIVTARRKPHRQSDEVQPLQHPLQQCPVGTAAGVGRRRYTTAPSSAMSPTRTRVTRWGGAAGRRPRRPTGRRGRARRWRAAPRFA
jgi:hypothetical protein